MQHLCSVKIIIKFIKRLLFQTIVLLFLSMLKQEKIFPSKKGFVIYIPLIVLLAVEVPYLWNGKYFGAALCFCILATLYLPALLNTYYAVDDAGTLRVKCGFYFNTKIDIASIRKIENTRTLLGSPALSLDRIEIFYNQFDTIVISPEDKPGFIAALQNINPAITY